MISKETVLPIEILLVDDNPGDVRMILEVLKDAKVLNTVHTAEDGDEAMRYLIGEGHAVGGPRPDLILLDLNLPGKSGQEVLEEIKSDPRLKSIPVVILTSSKAEEDIVRSYNLHANCFVTKPVNLDQFINVVKSIEEFWLTVVRLPEE